MKGEIINGVMKEINYLYGDTGCSVLFRTDFKPSNWPTYKMPLILIDIEPGGDFQQMLGGLTMADWRFYLSAYNYFPDISGLDPTSFSTDTQNHGDILRRQFSNYAVFKTDEMKKTYTDYGIRWTLSDVVAAEKLEHPDGLIDGDRIEFDTISWDIKTIGTVPGPAFNPDADHLVQLNNPPFD